MSRIIKCSNTFYIAWTVLCILAASLASADQTGMILTDQDTLSPLQTLSITVFDVNDFCEIYVTNPTGVTNTFSAQVQDNQATGNFIPSYLPGTYEVYAHTTGPEPVTETDTFQVLVPTESLTIGDWQCDAVNYVPGQNLTFTFDLADSAANPISGFSGQLSDTRSDSDSGRLSILRRIVDVAPNGKVTARLLVYFDTTGRWSNIYAGTEIRIGLHNPDGSSPLDTQILRSIGFENNPDAHLSATLTDTLWSVRVDTGFAGSDKIAYLDFEIPPTLSVSDVVVSIDYIKYNYNTGWNDRIYIRENYINTTSSGMVLTTNSAFDGLGRFPIYLPMTPNENGLLYYGIMTNQPIGESDINSGSISEINGTYTNLWQWEDYLQANADFYIYTDKWGYGHDYAGPIEITPQASLQQSLVINNFTTDSETYFPGESVEFSTLLTTDTADPVAGFSTSLADPVPNTTAGGMYILRQFLAAEPDGSSKARLYIYFDTTGQWSDIYAPTTVKISLYNKDGITPLTEEIVLTTGFINNDDNAVSGLLTNNEWVIAVDNNFSGADKIAFLDFDLPPGYSVSDVVFSVDSILYYCNRSWADTIYITTSAAGQSSFPVNLDGNYEYTDGSAFSSLGKFPIKLTLNPKPSGFIFYGIDSQDLSENNINDGSFSASGNEYHNVYTWSDYLHTTAQVFAYADAWQYADHAVSPPITLNYDDSPRELLVTDYTLDNRGYTLNDTRQMSARVTDGWGNPQSNLTFKEGISNSNNGKLSIFSQNVITDPNGHHVVRLLMYFDASGSWSDIYAGTQIQLSVYGADGKSGIPDGIQVVQGGSNADGYLTSDLTEEAGGVYAWTVDVVQNFAGADRQVWLDFVMAEPQSAAQVVYAVERIAYFCNRSWADSITIKNVTVNQNSFPTDYFDRFIFETGYRFGSLGRFPLYLTLNPGVGSVFPKMISTDDTYLDGSMAVSDGRYTYSHYMDEAGKDYETRFCVSRYGYSNNECRCSDGIMLLFTGQPRYLGGLETEPVMLGELWQKDLHEHFFIEVDYDNVQYTASDPGIIVTDHTAAFHPVSTDDTVSDVIITARSTQDPNLVAVSDPFTLYAADCITAADCNDTLGLPVSCDVYQCQTVEAENTYRSHVQGVDLSVFNKNLTISNPFPEPNETVTLCADIYNTGTTNIYDVVTEFYLDDVSSVPIDANSTAVLPTTYMDLPFRTNNACIQWTVPPDLQGSHRIWVKVSGHYPLEMEEDMLSNNYATIDFFVRDPAMVAADPAVTGDCPPPETLPLPMSAPLEVYNLAPRCQTLMMLIPIKIRVCENETICGPVMGYELGYWNTLYWPSWSGYCQEFDVPQEFITDFIRTYEKIYGLAQNGAASDLPSWTDIPGLFQPPSGWSDGWLPCHEEPTLFWPQIMYSGVMNPGCGGLCPVSAWDCGQGVSFQPRFNSPYYHAYEFKVAGGARTITRCHTDIDLVRVPYQICYTPGDDTPFRIPFTPFSGSPGGPDPDSYGPNGSAPPGSVPGGSPPFEFTVAGPPTDNYGNVLPFEVSFCSSGTSSTNEKEDILLLTPNGGLPEAGILLQKGWNQFAPLYEPLDQIADHNIPLKAGWNFFGYSSMTPFLWLNATVDDGNEEKSIEQAHAAGWIQGVLYTLDRQTLLYRYIPGDDDFLRNKQTYWLFADREGLTLHLPSVGGSAEEALTYWEEMLVANGPETLSVPEAAAAGWIDTSAYTTDPNEVAYQAIPADANELHAWRGYWLWSNMDGIILLTPQQQMLQQAAVSQYETMSSPQVELLTMKTAPVTADIGQPAPDFTLETTDGRVVTLRDYKGKDVLLVFGNTRCPYCSQKIPLLNQLQEERAFEVLYIALGATPADAETFVSTRQIRFTVLVDSNQLAGRQYGIRAIPEVVVIDPEGMIQQQTTTDGPILWYLLEGKEIPRYLKRLHPGID